MKEAFILAWRTLVRGRFLPILLLGAAAVTMFMPGLIRTDGTAAGARQLYIHSVLGCVAALVCISILCASCGHLAQSREKHRLSLAVIRPVGAFRAMVGIWLAYVAAAALALFAMAAVVYFRAPGGDVPCRHHVAPMMPSTMSVAISSIDEFLAKPTTPAGLRKAPRSSVLAYLAATEMDRYEPINPGASAKWDFPAQLAEASDLRLRVRFSMLFAARADLAGEFTLGTAHAVISNSTQAVVEVPLLRKEAGGDGKSANGANGVVSAEFKNTGKETVMLRPRQDLFILSPADSFGANMFRAMVYVLAGVALAAAFGLFLSAGLSRPVAVFTAFVSIVVIFIAPSVIDQYPDGAGLPLGDRIGLMLSRGVYAVTSSLSDASPIADLAEDRCVEWAPLVRAVLVNAMLVPLALLGFAAMAIRRKTLPDHV